MNLGKAFRDWRKIERLSMGDLAELLQVSVSLISELECGRVGLAGKPLVVGQLLAMGVPCEVAMGLFHFDPPECKHAKLEERPLFVNPDGLRVCQVCADCGALIRAAT